MTAPKLSHEEIRERLKRYDSGLWPTRIAAVLLAELETVTAQRDAWKEAAEAFDLMLDVAELDFKGDIVTFNPMRVVDNDRMFAALGKARQLDPEPDSAPESKSSKDDEPAGPLWDQPANPNSPVFEFLRNVTPEQIAEAAKNLDMDELRKEIDRRTAPYRKKHHADMTKVYGK